MGKNAQRRRAPANLRKLLAQLGRPVRSQLRSIQAQAWQAEHPDVIANRAARRNAAQQQRWSDHRAQGKERTR